MAVVQPYFQPDMNRGTPLFAAYFNGFMQRRTADNLNFMSRFLDNQDTKFLNAQIESIRKNRQELIKLRADILQADRKSKNEMLNTILKGKFQSSQANAGIARAMIAARGSVLSAGIGAAKGSKDFQRKTAKIENDTMNIKNLFNSPATKQAFNNLSTTTLDSDRTPAAILNYLQTTLEAEGAGIIDPEALIKDPARQKVALANFIVGLNNADSAFMESKKGQEVLSSAAQLMGLGPQDLSKETQRTALLNNITKISEGPLEVQSETITQLAKSLGQEAMELLTPVAAMERIELKFLKPYRDNEGKIDYSNMTPETKQQVERALIDKSVLAKSIQRGTKGAGVSSRTLAKLQKKFAPHLNNKYSDDAIKNLDAEIKNLGAELQAKGLQRSERISQIIKEGPGRAFKPFEKNYLLESPFKIESPESKKTRDFMKFVRRESIRPEKTTMSKALPNLIQGQIYSPINTPDLRVGVSKSEKPFIVREGAPYELGPEDGMYSSLVKVLQDINDEYAKTQKPKSRKRRRRR